MNLEQSLSEGTFRGSSVCSAMTTKCEDIVFSIQGTLLGEGAGVIVYPYTSVEYVGAFPIHLAVVYSDAVGDTTHLGVTGLAVSGQSWP